MKDIEQIKSIEKLNEEYLKLYHSKGVRFFRNIDKIRNSDFKTIFRLSRKKIIAKIGDLKMKRKVLTSDSTKEYYNFGKPLENIRVAVYTCITNGYDTPQKPIYISSDTDYYLYTDNILHNDTIWINKEVDCKKYLKEANRYYKFHPDIFKKEYDFAIYVDGNVKVISDVTTLCFIARNSKTGIAMHKHHARDCIYQEGLACKFYKRGNYDKISHQLDNFKKEGFPEHFGLCEATVIVYDLKNVNAEKLAHEWWENYYSSGAKRDQIFLPYIIWKNGYSMNDIGDLGNNIWNNPKFIIKGHD